MNLTCKTDSVEQHKQLESDLANKSSIREIFALRTNFFDRLISELANDLEFPVCFAALGGYGRKELNYFSDIDIVVLHNGLESRQIAKLDEVILSVLKKLSRKISPFNRSINQPLSNWQISLHEKTASLECRYICGEMEFYNSYRSHFIQYWNQTNNVADFLNKKNLENEKRLSEQAHQLNVKLSSGGLRDYHYFLWTNLVRGINPDQILSRKEKTELSLALDFVSFFRELLHRSYHHQQDVVVTREIINMVFNGDYQSASDIINQLTSSMNVIKEITLRHTNF